MAENLDHLFFIAFANVAEVAERTGSTADVAGPRPREVGGACRIQVLAAARTQETVGGPNGAKRSEFRRRCPSVGVYKSGLFAPVVLQIDHHGGESWAFAPVIHSHSTSFSVNLHACTTENPRTAITALWGLYV